MSAELDMDYVLAPGPKFVGLCPDPSHQQEFYMPLDDGEDSACPDPDCPHDLIVYERKP